MNNIPGILAVLVFGFEKNDKIKNFATSETKKYCKFRGKCSMSFIICQVLKVRISLFHKGIGVKLYQ